MLNGNPWLSISERTCFALALQHVNDEHVLNNPSGIVNVFFCFFFYYYLFRCKKQFVSFRRNYYLLSWS